MRFKTLFYVIVGLNVITSSCQFKEDPFFREPQPPAWKPKLLDSLRDKVMNFKVYDSVSHTYLGTETWHFLQSIYYPNYPFPFYEYYVYRNFLYDSSGGIFVISRPDEKFSVIREFNYSTTMSFLEGRYELWHPQDLNYEQFISQQTPGTTAIRTRTYKGVTPVYYNGAERDAFRAGRDSMAIRFSTPPYRVKMEDYFFVSGYGLSVMTENHYLKTTSGDSSLYKVYKIRQ